MAVRSRQCGGPQIPDQIDMEVFVFSRYFIVYGISAIVYEV